MEWDRRKKEWRAAEREKKMKMSWGKVIEKAKQVENRGRNVRPTRKQSRKLQ